MVGLEITGDDESERVDPRRYDASSIRQSQTFSSQGYHLLLLLAMPVMARSEPRPDLLRVYCVEV